MTPETTLEPSLDPIAAVSPSTVRITDRRLQSIDSLRGMAALGVTAYHLTGSYADSPIWTAYGFTGVFLFFVISGFCIHLRAAKGQEPNFVAFWKRRWLRLYPAYLASFLLYLWWADFNWFLVYDSVMHLLMLHNLDARTVYSMNGVWWTLAIEEQLYLLYFVLLWMRRKWGWPIVLGITLGCRFLTLAVSLALHRFGIEMPFTESAFSNWWIWTMGAVAVEAHFGLIKLPRICYSLILALILFVTTALLYYTGFVHEGTIYNQVSTVLCPPIWGLSFFILVARFARDAISLKFLAFIGMFSYSLYLTHEFVIRVLQLTFVVELGACLVFAYVFFRLFERPFMRAQGPPLPSSPSES